MPTAAVHLLEASLRFGGGDRSAGGSAGEGGTLKQIWRVRTSACRCERCSRVAAHDQLKIWEQAPGKCYGEEENNTDFLTKWVSADKFAKSIEYMYACNLRNAPGSTKQERTAVEGALLPVRTVPLALRLRGAGGTDGEGYAEGADSGEADGSEGAGGPSAPCAPPRSAGELTLRDR